MIVGSNGEVYDLKSAYSRVAGVVQDPDLDRSPETTNSGNAGGMKYDQGKTQWVRLRLDLLPVDALMWVSRVLVFGARKYKAHSWRTVPNARNRYLSALMRHWVAMQGGEVLDPESGLPHSAHMACDALFFCALDCAEKTLDAFAE